MNRYNFVFMIVLVSVFLNTAWCEEQEKFSESKPVMVSTGIRTGRVIDAVTGKPIHEAVVLYTWNTTEFLIESRSRLAALYETTTDNNGEYLIPNQQVEIKHPLMSKLEVEEVIVYKHGYVWYRVFGNKAQSFINYLLSLQQQYHKENNIVKLQPWIDELSHSEHIAFLASGLSRFRGQQLRKALEYEKKLAEKEHETNKPFQQKVKNAKKQFYQDQDTYKKGNITKAEYLSRLHRYLQIPDSNLLKLASLALKDLDDTAAIPVLIEFLKRNIYRRSFEESFYNLRWAIGNPGFKAPRSIAGRKEFIARAEDWWEQNKDRSCEDWDTDEIANLFDAVKDKPSEVVITHDDIMVDPALQKFDDPNNSPLAVFVQLRTALLAEDIDKVVFCFVPYKRAEYAEFYKNLKPHFQKMAEDMKGLALVSQNDGIVECDMLCQESDGIFGYPITFVKDENGKWWIQEL